MAEWRQDIEKEAELTSFELANSQIFFSLQFPTFAALIVSALCMSCYVKMSSSLMTIGFNDFLKTELMLSASAGTWAGARLSVTVGKGLLGYIPVKLAGNDVNMGPKSAQGRGQ